MELRRDWGTAKKVGALVILTLLVFRYAFSLAEFAFVTPTDCLGIVCI